MLIGYSRVSTDDQNPDRQVDLLTAAGCGKIFTDKISGVRDERPALSELMNYAREGDLIVVTDLSRLGRSVKFLISFIEQIKDRGIGIRSLSEPWMDTSTPQGNLIFVIFAGLCQFQRDNIRSSCMEGIKSARARGRVGGRPRKDADKVRLAIEMYKSGKWKLRDIRDATGISKSTLYAYLGSGE